MRTLLAQAVYGLPELYGKARRQRKISCESGLLSDLCDSWAFGRWWKRDGSRPAAASSAIANPVLRGAGKEPKRELHFVEVDENFRAYGLFTPPAHAGSYRASWNRCAAKLSFPRICCRLARGILVHALRLARTAARGSPKSRRSIASFMPVNPW